MGCGMLKVFFSYTKTYEPIAKELAGTLSEFFRSEWSNRNQDSEPEFKNWRVDSIPAGGDLWSTLEEEVGSANVFVAIICEFYERKIAGKEFDAFSKLVGERRLIPILLAKDADKVWNNLKASIKNRDGSPRELVWCDLRNGYDDNNQLKLYMRQELISACRAAVEFVLKSTELDRESRTSNPDTRPGVVVMGRRNGDDASEESEARGALIEALSDNLPNPSIVDLGHDWDSDEAEDRNLALLRPQADATDLCLVSVRSRQRIEEPDTRLVSDTARRRLKQDFELVSDCIRPHAAVKLHRLVWLVGTEELEPEEVEGVQFVSGDATVVSRQVLREIGVIDACPFLVEDIGNDAMVPWFQRDLPSLLFEPPPESAPRPCLMNAKDILEALRDSSKRAILAISDKGAPSRAKVKSDSGVQHLRSYILERVAQFEDLIERAGPTRPDNTLRLLFQITGHMNLIGNCETAPSGRVWHILRVDPNGRTLLSEPDEHKNRIKRFMMGQSV